MPIPSNSTAILRPDLAMAAYEFSLGAATAGYIGTMVLPYFETDLQAAEYPVIPLEALLSIPETERRSGGAYARDDFQYGKDKYGCTENGFEEPVDDSTAKSLARYFDAEMVATQRCMNTILRRQEKRIADMLYNETNFAPHAVGKAWSDDAADPFDEVSSGKEAIENLTGITPNTLIINRSQSRKLSMCPALIDRIKYTNPNVQRGQVSAQLFAQYFDVDRVLIAGGIYNAAQKGLDASIAKMWSDTYAMLCVTSGGGQDLKEPSLGRTFLWTGDSPQPVVAEMYREEQIRGNVVRARQNTDEKFTMTSAGYLLKGVL